MSKRGSKIRKSCIFSKNKVHLSVGNILGSSGYLAQGKIFGGLHWGTFSVGDRMRNISFSGGYGYFNDKSYSFDTPSQDALFLGLGGIAPIGEKASFILDAMLISNTRNNRNYDVDQISQPRPRLNTTDPNITNTTLILMPGMRFNKSYNKAFQISLAGVFFTDNSRNTEIGDYPNYTYKKGETISFPVPTISWLRKF
mgnify:CR=1 FL=1